MEDLKPIIARNISELRQRSGLTQLELAEKLNYSDKAISKWERGESIPDITVLKVLADLFGVTVDYLIQSEHKNRVPELKREVAMRFRNHGFITGMCIVLVWIVALLSYIIADNVPYNGREHWFAFIYAVPLSFVVWLIFNSIWFNKHRNFLIISFLMWSILASLYITFLRSGFNIWLIFALGIPGQALIFMWSKLKYKK